RPRHANPRAMTTTISKTGTHPMTFEGKTKTVTKKVVLVGHCGPDSSYLRMAVSQADKSLHVLMADDMDELEQLLNHGGADLLLLNRELAWGFHDLGGVDVIRKLRAS